MIPDLFDFNKISVKFRKSHFMPTIDCQNRKSPNLVQNLDPIVKKMMDVSTFC